MPTQAQHVLGEGGIFYFTKKIMKEISMQNDEHGPVDTSRLCFVGCFSVIPCFPLSPPCISPSLFISPFSTALPFCVSFSASLVSVSVRPSCPRPPRLH